MKDLKLKGKFFGLLAALVIPMSAVAQDDETKLVIYGQDGKPAHEISIYDIRKITFQDDGFTMILEEGVGDNVMFAYDDVSKMNFTGCTTGIGSVKEDVKDGITIRRNGDIINVSGVDGNAQLRIYDIAGRPVISTKVNGCAEINTTDLMEGVYILRVNNKTFKFSKF